MDSKTWSLWKLRETSVFSKVTDKACGQVDRLMDKYTNLKRYLDYGI